MQKSVLNRSKAIIALLIATLFVGFGLSGCASTEPLNMATVTSVIDVRTPAEYAEGHLEGALNIDVESPLFAEQIGELDPSGTYVVYCRSGNRSAVAIDLMKGMGFTDLINGGGYADASARTGLPIVQ